MWRKLVVTTPYNNTVATFPTSENRGVPACTPKTHPKPLYPTTTITHPKRGILLSPLALLLAVIVFTIMGVCAGIITGLVPGIHVNTVACTFIKISVIYS